jgi:hypothetical protein
MAGNKAKVSQKSKGRSRMSNGHILPASVDLRSKYARRLRDLLALHLSDMAGTASESEKSILRRGCVLSIACEHLEAKFAKRGHAEPHELLLYQRTANSARRMFESIGLERRMRTVQSFGNLLREDAERQQIIDAEVSERKRAEFEARQREQKQPQQVEDSA